MPTGWLLIICSYCCLHLNPIWSELHARLHIPEALLLEYSLFPFAGFCSLLCGSFRHLVCRTAMNAWDGLILPRCWGSAGTRGWPQPRRCPRSVGGGQRSPAAAEGLHFAAPGCRRGARSLPSPYQGSWVTTVDTLSLGLTWKLPLQKPHILKNILKNPQWFAWSAPRWGHWGLPGLQAPAPR